MKKIKSILCILLLSICLVGNVFANNTNGIVIFTFYENFVNTILYYAGDGDCKPRQCQTCRPIDIIRGNCRPSEG